MPEHVQDDSVAGRADDAEGCQNAHHDVEFYPALPDLVRLQNVAAAARADIAVHRYAVVCSGTPDVDLNKISADAENSWVNLVTPRKM